MQRQNQNPENEMMEIEQDYDDDGIDSDLDGNRMMMEVEDE